MKMSNSETHETFGSTFWLLIQQTLVIQGRAGGNPVSRRSLICDAATGAMGVAYGEKILTFDAPLILETEPQLITIAAK
jgi:hypothetical protein